MSRILGIDYGDVRIGLAISDPMEIIASRLQTLDARKNSTDQILQQIQDICIEYDVQKIVLGLPKRTDGKIGEKEIAVREFAERLFAVTNLKPILLDERYTTVLANRIMRETGVKREQKKHVVDQIAAEIILQEYLNS